VDETSGALQWTDKLHQQTSPILNIERRTSAILKLFKFVLTRSLVARLPMEPLEDPAPVLGALRASRSYCSNIEVIFVEFTCHKRTEREVPGIEDKNVTLVEASVRWKEAHD
jgi:hypothetical protein